MNFKIENNFLDITNYPSIEKHFEDMASKGWLINRVILGSIFIYKKIQPEELDFSIAPYEVETAFTRKSKEELEEFNSVCKSVGWNYATKSFDLHIYFKEKGSEARDIQTDEEEEFRTLEFIGKRRVKSYYFQIPFVLFVSWILLGNVFNNIYSMKDGFAQIVAPLVPLGIILNIWGLIHIKGFLKKNRKNMEIGKDIEYSDSNFYIPKITFPITGMFLAVLVIYGLYSSIILRNRFLLITFFPVLIAGIIGTAYRFVVKPSKKSLRYKKIGFVLTIIVAVFISVHLGVFSIGNIIEGTDNPNIEGYKVLSMEDFSDTLKEEGDLTERVSLLVPRSYEYYSRARGNGSILTEYSKVLTENLASNLVNRYIRQAENASTGRFGREVELYFKEGIFDGYLLESGMNEWDLNQLKHKELKEAKKAARKIIHERSIVEDQENLWNVDEVYFLNYRRTEIVLRDGREVFYLEGKDFSDMEIIEIVKDKLDLN